MGGGGATFQALTRAFNAFINKPFALLTLVAFLFIGCDLYRDRASKGGNNNSISYNISFYNADLDLVETKSILGGSINPSSHNSLVLEWYKANESAATTNHNLDDDIRFYAIPNVKEITTQAELANIGADATTLAGKYILLNDIALSDSGAGVDSSGWNPIGSDFNRFKGIFNGNGYKITNLWINIPSTDNVGLFGYIEGAKIRNLGVEINNSKGGVQGYNSVGGIAGSVVGNSSITNSYVAGSVSGTGRVGGIAGYVVGNSSSITNSYVAGSVSGVVNVGGIAGCIESSAIITNNAAINPSVSATSYINRVVGYIKDGTVS
ncbi:MAG: hypothetical protein LBP89_05125, partial [Helicobacteraceae bacterium]|nr:hypothetical protein [Helicobacteraceae bacterium]